MKNRARTGSTEDQQAEVEVGRRRDRRPGMQERAKGLGFRVYLHLDRQDISRSMQQQGVVM